MNAERTLDDVASALRRQTRVDFDHHPIEIALSDDGVVTLSGTVRDLAAKRIAVRAASEIPGVRSVVDLLTVPAAEVGDGALRVHVRDALLGEPTLLECSIKERSKGQTRMVRNIVRGRGEIDIEVEGGSVYLRGTLPSLSHRRLAVALAWHVPGVRNVVDQMGISPPEADHDGEIADALLLVLETTRTVDPASITIHVEDAVITLRGWVPTVAERAAIERDAWCVEGVRGVVNELEIAPAVARTAAR